MQELLAWFEQLGSSKQIDEVAHLFMTDALIWLQSLSLNQRLVFCFSLLLTMIFLKNVFAMISRIFVKSRRWFRRKRIPKEVNLHLDRDIDSD